MPLVCQNIACGADAQSLCGDCGLPYCSVACQKHDWSSHKSICAVLAAKRKADEPETYKQPKTAPAFRSEETVRADIGRLISHRFAYANDIATAYSSEATAELIAMMRGTFSDEMIMSVQDRLTKVHQHYQLGLAAALRRKPETENQIDANLDKAMEIYRGIRADLLIGVGEDSERMREKEINAIVELSYQNLLHAVQSEAKDETEVAPSPMAVQGCLDFATKLLSPGGDESSDEAAPTASRMRSARRLQNIARRTGGDQNDLWGRLLDKIRENLPDMSLRDAGLLAAKVTAMILCTVALGRGYLAVRHRISGGESFEAAKALATQVAQQTETAQSLISDAATMIEQSGAEFRSTTAMMVDRASMIQNIRSLADDSVEGVVNLYKALMDKLLATVQGDLEAARAIALLPASQRVEHVGTAEVIETADLGAIEMVTRWRNSLATAKNVSDLKEVAQLYKSTTEGMSGVKLDALANASKEFETHLAAGIGKLKEANVVLAESAAAAKKTHELIARGVSSVEKILSTTPLMTWLARTICSGAELGEGAVHFVQWTMLGQLTALEGVFGTFVYDLSQASSAWTFGTAGLSFIGNLGAGLYTGQLTGILSLILSGSTAALTKLEQVIMGWRNSVDASLGGAAHSIASTTLTAFYVLISGNRNALQVMSRAMTLSTMATTMFHLAIQIIAALFSLVIAISQIGLLWSSAIGVGVLAAVFYNYACRATPINLGELVAPVVPWIMAHGLWYARLVMLAIAGITMAKHFNISKWTENAGPWFDYLRTHEAPDIRGLYSVGKPIEIEQLETARTALATAISRTGATFATATQLLGVEAVYAAGVMVSQ